METDNRRQENQRRLFILMLSLSNDQSSPAGRGAMAGVEATAGLRR
jgi:hypothetical protein